MIPSVREDAKRRKLAGAAVLAFAVAGLVLSWVSAHAATATTLEPITISAPALKVAGHDTLTNPSLRRIRITARVGLDPVSVRRQAPVQSDTKG
jgi:hypothetical protein